MRAFEILSEGYGQQRYGSWVIKFTDQPTAGKYKAVGHLVRKGEAVASVKGDGDTKEAAIQNVKQQIDANVATQAKQQTKIKSSDVIRTTIDFNVEVTKQIFNHYEPTAARFVEDDGIVYIDIMTPEWFEEHGYKSLPGFVRIHDRKMGSKYGTATKGYGTKISPKTVDRLGLEFNGRYTLDEIRSDDDAFRRFKLLFDSVVQNPQDRFVLGVPGLTIATWTKGKTSNETL